MAERIDKERAIRSIVSSAVKAFANGFSTRHLAEVDDENGVINMKIHNVFIAALGPEIQYYSALARSLDSSLGNMLEDMAISIAELNYEVSQHVEGILYKEQTDFIAELLEQYKRRENRRTPKLEDYQGISKMTGTAETKRHESDYYLIDKETGMHYLIELKKNEVLVSLAKNHLPFGRKTWKLICKDERGYDFVLNEIQNVSHIISGILEEYKHIAA